MSTPSTAVPVPPGNAAAVLRPAINDDNAYFWAGVSAGELRIQRCASCGALRHPSSPACAVCRSLTWDYVVSSGAGRVHSTARVHHPLLPPFGEPYWIAVIDLPEGVRMAAQLGGYGACGPPIGEPVRAQFVVVADDLTLPVFVPDTR